MLPPVSQITLAQISQIIQSGIFFGRPIGQLPKVGLPLMKNVLTLLAKSVLIPITLTAAASTANAGIH